MFCQKKKLSPAAGTNYVFGKACIGIHWGEGHLFVLPHWKKRNNKRSSLFTQYNKIGEV